MTTTTQPPVAPPEPPAPEPVAANLGRADLKRFLLGIVGFAVTVYAMVTVFQAIVLFDFPRVLQGLLAIAGGVGGAVALFTFLNLTAEGLPRRWEGRLKPYVFLLPAAAFIGVFLLYPAVQTIVYSFADSESEAWVGFDNYTRILGDSAFRETIVNNLLWLAVVPVVTVALGLLVAVLADKLSARWESTAKSLIFLPMAISFVGAAAVWRFVYDYASGGDAQIGILNAAVKAIGIEPVAWLNLSDFNANDFLLMVILIWLQTGFAMVLLSAAVKGVPEETLEAARIDGASELKTFFFVVVPQIRGTLITVFITVFILVMKVFDVVYVMTGGQFGTNVIGLEFFKQIFQFGDNGVAAAIVVLLLLAVIPVLIYQVRHFKAEEATR